MATPWRKPFDPNLEIQLSCKSEAELDKRIEDMEGRGFVLIERYVDTARGSATTYEKHVAKMRRVE